MEVPEKRMIPLSFFVDNIVDNMKMLQGEMKNSGIVSNANYRKIMTHQKQLRRLLKFLLDNWDNYKLIKETKQLISLSLTELETEGLSYAKDYREDQFDTNIFSWAYLSQNPQPQPEIAYSILSRENYELLPSTLAARNDWKEKFIKARAINASILDGFMIRIVKLGFEVETGSNIVMYKRPDISINLIANFYGTDAPQSFLAVSAIDIPDLEDKFVLKQIAGFVGDLNIHFMKADQVMLDRITPIYPHFVFYVTKNTLLARFFGILSVDQRKKTIYELIEHQRTEENEKKSVSLRMAPRNLQIKLQFTFDFYNFNKFKGYQFMSNDEIIHNSIDKKIFLASLESGQKCLNYSSSNKKEFENQNITFVCSRDQIRCYSQFDAEFKNASLFLLQVQVRCRRHVTLLIFDILFEKLEGAMVKAFFFVPSMNPVIDYPDHFYSFFCNDSLESFEACGVFVEAGEAIAAVCVDPHSFFIRGELEFRAKTFDRENNHVKNNELKNRLLDLINTHLTDFAR